MTENQMKPCYKDKTCCTVEQSVYTDIICEIQN